VANAARCEAVLTLDIDPIDLVRGRASLDLLCEHITNVVMALSELRALEEEINEIGQGLAGNTEDVVNLSFESDSLSDTLDEAEDELERLSSILIEGKKRNPRGH
ncbi:MAG TPA: hypothetical protein VLR90_02000, partial [Blastocatellia bacterium]|nr:hypothetical protein [Blastocatellia bacterium]